MIVLAFAVTFAVSSHVGSLNIASRLFEYFTLRVDYVDVGFSDFSFQVVSLGFKQAKVNSYGGGRGSPKCVSCEISLNSPLDFCYGKTYEDSKSSLEKIEVLKGVSELFASHWKKTRNLNDEKRAKIVELENQFGFQKFLYSLDFQKGKATVEFSLNQENVSKNFESLLKMASSLANGR